MALSVVEGHQEGGITDFKMMDIPFPDDIAAGATGVGIGGSVPDTRKGGTFHEKIQPAVLSLEGGTKGMIKRPGSASQSFSSMSSFGRPVDTVENREVEADMTSTKGTWQHVLSVGRDGLCLLQSFARGMLLLFRLCSVVCYGSDWNLPVSSFLRSLWLPRRSHPPIVPLYSQETDQSREYLHRALHWRIYHLSSTGTDRYRYFLSTNQCRLVLRWILHSLD